MAKVIEGEYCRMHFEGKVWELCAVNGVRQWYSCPADDLEQASQLVDEYDERARERIRLEEQHRGKAFTDEELIREGRNPVWVQLHRNNTD